ncbi:MAG: hypothetical protein Q8S73_31615 [Deltaproteobacteria bacterium]|nr:hypothetical protein [Myxococcales bacterium]MDP3218695.1 hypothetical protein [Deltaproteobacteria bacterium]
MNLRLLASALGLVVASQSLTGCFFLWDRNDPDEPPLLVPPRDEAVSFRFLSSRGCGPFSGAACTAERPLMVGVRERMEVDIPSNPTGADPTVTSSDPSVIEVGAMQRVSTQGGGYLGAFDVRAGERTGSAEVTITQADGQSSTVRVRVDEAAGMDLVEDEGTSRYDRTRDHITLRVGERVSMNGYPVTINGERLLANDGVIWTVPSDERVNLSWTFMSGARVADDHVYVEGRSRGTEVLTVRAGVVERTLVVEVR